MNITRNSVIAGLPGKDARDYVRELLRFTSNTDGMSAARLPKPPGHKNNLPTLSLLQDAGFVAFDRTKKIWCVTANGLQLAGARVGKRIPHTQAIALVQAVVARVAEINEMSGLMSYVSSVRVFGSTILPEKVDHGDVDIAYSTNNRRILETFYRSLDSGTQKELLISFSERFDIAVQPVWCGQSDSLPEMQARWVKREIAKVSRIVGAANFSDHGLRHLTGEKHLVFFSRGADYGGNYQAFIASSEDEIMHGGLENYLEGVNPEYAEEARQTAWGILERCEAIKLAKLKQAEHDSGVAPT